MLTPSRMGEQPGGMYGRRWVLGASGAPNKRSTIQRHKLAFL
jgi:hypothetical protein